MNPPLAAPRGTGAAPEVPRDTGPRRDPPAVRRLGVALFIVSALAGVALASAGAGPPPLGPVALLAALLALGVNRYTFFPNELAVTAEAAAVLAAVVAFAGDAPFLGPLVVAMLVGPVDLLHWEQRAFTRMAHNAGDRALAALAAAAAFAAVTDGTGDETLRTGLGIAAATLAFVTVEVALGAALLRVLGEVGWRATVGHVARLEALTVPLGVIGGCAGVVAAEQNWSWALLVLAPLPWVPELVLGARGLRSRTRTVSRVATAAGALLLAAAAVGLSPTAERRPMVVVAAAAILLGIELRVSHSEPVAPLAVLAVLPVVTATSAVTPGAGILRTAAVGAAVGCAGWSAAGGVAGASWRGPVLAGAAGASAGAVASAWAPAGPIARVVCTTTAAVAFLAVALVVSWRRGPAAVRVLWTSPVVLAAVLLAVATPSIGTLTCVLGIGGALALVAHFASPPWSSRWLVRSGRAHAARPRRAFAGVVGLAAAAVTLTTVARVSSGDVRTATAWCAAATAEVALAVAMATARQWRFDPARRRARALVASAAAIGVTVSFVPLADVGSGWSLFAVCVALFCALWAAWLPSPRTTRPSSAPVREGRGSGRDP